MLLHLKTEARLPQRTQSTLQAIRMNASKGCNAADSKEDLISSRNKFGDMNYPCSKNHSWLSDHDNGRRPVPGREIRDRVAGNANDKGT
jgi:hypothetical protein